MTRVYALGLLCAAAFAAPDTDCLSLTRYLVLTNEQAVRAQLLECPNHAFGGMENGIKEIENRKLGLLPGQTSFVQFCVGEQVQSVQHCMPLVDMAAINPFKDPASRTPATQSFLWPGCEPPCHQPGPRTA